VNFIKTFKEHTYLRNHKKRLDSQLFLIFSISIVVFFFAFLNSLFNDFLNLVCFLLSMIGVLYAVTKERYRCNIKNRLGSMIYVGDLNEIFDLNSDIDNKILSSNSLEIEEDFIQNQGISGKLILNLHEQIKDLKNIQHKELELQEKIKNNSDLKLMIEQLKFINSKKMDEE
jgi:uncharacterized membrane protein